jgi:hypothetical protein
MDVMILEGIVTTLGPDQQLNVAPMGPRVDEDMRRFTLRPFQTSTTFRNLARLGEGVLHVTDDVLLFARAALGLELDEPVRPADMVQGMILTHACRYHEFRVVVLDDREQRANITVETVAEGRFRDFFGFNRAKHAVIEAAVLATRTDFLPIAEILDDFRKLAAPVEKTGGDQERAAFRLLLDHVEKMARDRGVVIGPANP